MIYAFDFEFNDTGKDFEVISVGIAAEDGRTYYAQNPSFNWSNIDTDKFWLRANVKPGLKYCPGNIPQWLHRDNQGDGCLIDGCTWKPLSRMASEIAEFTDIRFGVPEFWGFFVAWDWIIMCRLYGRVLFDIPPWWPQRASCIAQYAADHKLKIIRDSSYTHNSLDDAKWTLREVQRLKGIEL